MHPELFHIDFFGYKQTIYTYAFLIALGTLIAVTYTKWRAKKELGIYELSNNFFYLVFIAGFIGGKVFYYLEKPKYFLDNPELMLNNFSGGFVFYGSFIFIIPVVIWYLKKHKIPILPMLDILAITTIIVHSIGRLGCFFGGCCYGKPTDVFTGIDFPKTNGIKVHPTQLYEITALIIILLILLYIKKKQQFKGQLFILYLILYAIARSILELFRGDKRGFIIEDILSHSQFIGMLFIFIAIFLYKKLNQKSLKIIN
jgi:phosphatidylglycerol:prolipoprotein diacylglycerol transferase